MQERTRQRFSIMSSCLKQFKSITTALQKIGRQQKNMDNINELIACSNKFIELADQCQKQTKQSLQAETQSERTKSMQYQLILLNRFFGRIREIIYSNLTYYINTNTHVTIRQLLMDINTQIMQYKPNQPTNSHNQNNNNLYGDGSHGNHNHSYHNLLITISKIIMRLVNRVISQAKKKQEIDQQILERIHEHQLLMKRKQGSREHRDKPPSHQKQSQQKTKRQTENSSGKTRKLMVTQQSQSTLERLKSLSKEKQKSIQNERTYQVNQYLLSKCKNMGLEIISDLDYSHFSINTKSWRTEELFKDCVNRNRNISFLIKSYVDAYQVYSKKPVNKRNREQDKQQRQRSKQRYKYPVQSNPIINLNNINNSFVQCKNDASTNTHISRNIDKTKKHTRTLTENRTKLFNKTVTQCVVQADYYKTTRKNQVQIKQELLSQIYAYRNKYQVSRINIGVVNFNIMNNSSNSNTIYLNKSASTNRNKVPPKDMEKSTSNTNFNINLSSIQRETVGKKLKRFKMKVGPAESQRFRAHSNRSYLKNIVSMPLK